MTSSFLFHDYETFGADPRRDRPSQFAAIRTDDDFNVIGEPVIWYCQPADDYLPHPDACLLTGITPQKARREGMPEAEFAGRINELMQTSNTCALGYNTLRFDDEISRHLFYRNFIDPYAREWQNGNSRWDLIDAVRAFYALRPDGIEWPEREPGVPSFKLEHLSAANGIDHGNAHDALADVYATIELAKLLKSKNAKLFDYLLSLKSKHVVSEKLDITRQKPMLHVSRRYPAARGCSALIVPLAKHPTNPNGVIVYDLAVDPAPLFELSADDIRARVFASAEELSEGTTRIPLKVIHINRSPVVMPISVVDERVAERLSIDKATAEQHWQGLAGRTDVAEKARAVFSEPPGDSVQDPDLMLYGGAFFGSTDKREMAKVREAEPEALTQWSPSFQDPRLEEMLFRYRARNYPETLSGEEKAQWDRFRWERMNSPQLSSLTLRDFARLIERYNQSELEESKRHILEELVLYVEAMMPEDAFG
ncbi:exodeoxyribonuclease I [Larsenimonas suaedae]|uniref:Exodeoxyribonuclease I n=1 Tax=Larsenimonas suaedae TaxID=1851019 RepID=A0ABU1GYG5_9GAMM|nr:exodeoxyribonuclease I [Larsenimonas suaedae]MCM2973160.1 exodeoxyribonuclease I [Larsenimonas suaedae]MDR5896597.1 exodeoxyribonuclease I [Larsenimonas suaedae]